MPLQLSIFVIFIYFVYKIYYKLRYKLPPGPYAWPIIGNLYNMKPERLQSYFEWSKTFGPIISVWIGSNLNIVVSNSQLAKEVLKDNDQQLAYRHRSWVLSKSTKGGKDFIWADYGPHYIKVRKVCTIELFSFKSLEALRHIREDEVKSMVGSIFKNCINIPQNQLGGSLMVRKYLGSLAFNIVTRIVFGKRFEDKEGVLDTQGLELKAILDNEQNKTALLSILQTLWWLEWLFLFKNKEFSQHLSRKNKLVQQIIEEHKLEVVKNGYAKQHFVAALIGMQKDYRLSEDTITGLLWDMITAGVDTIAISIEWALAQLVKNPRVQKKAQEELDRVIGQDRIMTESDIPNLPYLQCVVKEALRLHPPTPLMLPHKANSNVKVGGYDIPKGTNVIVNVWALGRDQEIWKSPLEFRPERFMEEDVDIKGHDFRLLPFGAGRRICPAAQLSSILLTSMLGHLLHHFYWTMPQDVQPDEIDMMEIPGLVTYMRTPLQVVPIQRLPQHLYNHVV